MHTHSGCLPALQGDTGRELAMGGPIPTGDPTAATAPWPAVRLHAHHTSGRSVWLEAVSRPPTPGGRPSPSGRRCPEGQKAKLKQLLAYNHKPAAAYQIKEELLAVLSAPDEAAMAKGMAHILRRTQLKANTYMRKLHDSLLEHLPQILALGKYRPPVGRIEALNNNWETLVRRGRGYRDHQHPFRTPRFITANPLQTEAGVRAFLALAA